MRAARVTQPRSNRYGTLQLCLLEMLMGEGRGESCIPATSALQDTRRQTTIIQERETQGDSSTAKYSVLSVCFVPSLSPLPLCPQPLPSLHTGTLSIADVLVRF